MEAFDGSHWGWVLAWSHKKTYLGWEGGGLVVWEVQSNPGCSGAGHTYKPAGAMRRPGIERKVRDSSLVGEPPPGIPI